MKKLFTIVLMLLASPLYAVYPGLNGKVAFASNFTNNPEIYTINPDGTCRKQLTNTPQPERDPSWSADGTKIAFRSLRDGNSEIYIMNADGTNQQRLTNNPGFDWVPHMSPDGQKIAFTRSEHQVGGNPHYQIYIIDKDGNNEVKLTSINTLPNGYTDAIAPRFSPDGTKILFWGTNHSNNVDGKFAIFTMNTDGTNVCQYTADELRAAEGDWSPDGSKIIFSLPWTRKGELGQIAISYAPGTICGPQITLNDVQPVTTMGNNHFPKFSPDGNSFVFAHEDCSSFIGCVIIPDIYVSNLDGTNILNLTPSPQGHSQYLDHNPDWGVSPLDTCAP